MTRPRSLWPREHGAYVQLLVPLLTALGSRVPTFAAALLAVAACAAFLANEPLLVVLGHRGARMKARDGDRARTRLAFLVALACATGGGGLTLAGGEASMIAALVALPCLAVMLLAWRRAEHTFAGEAIAAVAVSGLAAPVAVANGVSPATALWIWGAWSLGFGATVIAVHRVIARHRHPAGLADLVSAIGMVAAVIAVILLSRASLYPALPLVVLAFGVILWPPRATRLRALGVAVTVVAATTGACTAIIVA